MWLIRIKMLMNQLIGITLFLQHWGKPFYSEEAREHVPEVLVKCKVLLRDKDLDQGEFNSSRWDIFWEVQFLNISDIGANLNLLAFVVSSGTVPRSYICGSDHWTQLGLSLSYLPLHYSVIWILYCSTLFMQFNWCPSMAYKIATLQLLILSEFPT